MARPLADNVPDVEEWNPSPADRCDFECPAQAMVKATGLYGELMFCHHHYNQIISNNAKQNKLKAFAFDVQDKSSILEKSKTVE